MNCINVCEENYDRYNEYYSSRYSQVEFTYKRIKFAYDGQKVDHHMLLISYVTGKSFFRGETWEYVLCDNYDTYQFSNYDEIDRFIRRKYEQYGPDGTMEVFTEPFYKGANFWEWFSGEDENW